MQNWIAKNFQKMVFWPIYLILKIFFGFEVRGQERLKKLKDKGTIFTSNHASIFDGVITATAIAMPWNGFSMGEYLPIRYMAYADYFNWFNMSGKIRFPFSIPASAWMKLSACIPVKSRDKNSVRPQTEDDHIKMLKDMLEYPIEALKNGERIFIFLEGDITPDGMLQTGKRGIASLHRESNAPIVPIGLQGTFKMFSWENLKKFIRREKKIVIIFGDPVKLFNPNPNRTLEDGANMVMDDIAKLLAE